MKAKEITLNLTRNLGNYETARMAVTYEVTDDDDVVDSFVSAKMEIDEAFERLFPEYYGYSNNSNYVEKSVESNYDNETTIKKLPLTIDNDDKFLKLKNRIMSGALTIEDVEKYYELGDYEREVLAEIQKLKEDEN